MRKITLLLTVCSLLLAPVFAQQNLQGLFDRIKPVNHNTSIQPQTIPTDNYSPHLAQFFKNENKYKSFYPNLTRKQSRLERMASYPDTIIVGVYPYDTLTITGTLTHNGPIFVALNGLLIIKNANLTNYGDLVVFNNGRVIIDSSTISYPQLYFYQRSLTLVNKAQVSISNTTLSYGGMSHNCLVTDTAQLSYSHVTQTDWTTTGMSRRGAITINGTNQAGEFIISDYVNLNIKNATTALLWHQFPDTAQINWSFGTRDTAYNYQFNNTKLGVRGIEYNVTADSVYNVMWALMPSVGSNVNLSNSKIRAIGLWFDAPHDSTAVSGITDNATYSVFTTPLSDRTLTFSNCTVQTWSFYVFHKSVINVTGCIAGEIGCENSSKMYGSNYVVDGSGGYHWSADTSTIFSSGATVYSYVRSEGQSIFVFAYGSVTGGTEAINNSLLIAVQNQLSSDPTAVNGGTAELDYIGNPGNMYADSLMPVYGSAWIHNGPTSPWMHFKNWQLFYRSVDSTNWIPVTGTDTIPVSNGLLAKWNTHSLLIGNYELDLRITDTWGNKVDAVRSVTLLPLVFGVNEVYGNSDITLYPNPNSGAFTLQVNNEKLKVNNVLEIYNMLGEKALTLPLSQIGEGTQIDLSDKPDGVYLYRILGPNNDLISSGKFVIQK